MQLLQPRLQPQLPLQPPDSCIHACYCYSSSHSLLTPALYALLLQLQPAPSPSCCLHARAAAARPGCVLTCLHACVRVPLQPAPRPHKPFSPRCLGPLTCVDLGLLLAYTLAVAGLLLLFLRGRWGLLEAYGGSSRGGPGRPPPVYKSSAATAGGARGSGRWGC